MKEVGLASYPWDKIPNEILDFDQVSLRNLLVVFPGLNGVPLGDAINLSEAGVGSTTPLDRQTIKGEFVKAFHGVGRSQP